jgi:hypothetical protein
LKSLLQKSIILLLITCALVFIQATLVLAEDTGGSYYFMFNALNTSIGDKFDGISGCVSKDNDKIGCFIPKLDDGNGLEFTFGELRGRFAGEIYYSSSLHQGTSIYLSNSSNCTYENIGLNFKYFFIKPESSFSIYGLLGIGRPKVTYEDGAFDITNSSSPKYDNASFSGVGYNIGLGAIIKINHNLILEGSCKLSQLSIGRSYEFGQEYVIENNFSATEQTYSIGLVYIL